MEKKQLKSKQIWEILFIIILILYPLRHIMYGVELTDTGYSLGNFTFFEQMDGMWVFATFLANVTGAALTRLPFGQYMMGMNVYTGLFVSLTVLISYVFFTRVLKMPRWIAFVGELLAASLCWCPTAILYNYLTYLFFTIGFVFLYLGLTREKRGYLILAGMALGINVLVRFPNLAEAALILAVWYWFWMKKDLTGKQRWLQGLLRTIDCIIGYLLGTGIVLVGISLAYGFGNYVQAIQNLMNMPQSASDYTLYSMVLTVLLDYKASSRWLFAGLLVMLIGMGGSFLFQKLIIKNAADCSKGIWKVASLVLKAVYLLMIGILILFLYRLGVFNLKYYTYECMFQWVAVLLIITICVLCYLTFKGENTSKRLVALMLLILIGVTPLGSNNHLYPNMNNLFLVFPFILEVLCQKARELVKAGGRKFPQAALLIIFLLIVAIQTMGFGVKFVFRDGMSGQIKDTAVQENMTLQHMVTNKENAEAIEGLTKFIQSDHNTQESVLLYGQIPAVSYFVQLPSAISTSWPDLRSYSLETFRMDLGDLENRMKQRGEKPPLIIVSSGIQGYWEKDKEAMAAGDVVQEVCEKDKKLGLLSDMIEKYDYQISYQNTKFVVYESDFFMKSSENDN